jgi:hypothetical protein
VELEPEKSLVLSWLEEGSGWLNPARLVIALVPTDTGTRVTLIHDGFEGIGRSDWLRRYRIMSAAPTSTGFSIAWRIL